MTDTLLNIEVDGIALQARKGAMVIEVTDAAGITVPRFCYHKKLSVAANCRMCLVEVEKAPKPLPACATPVADGMKVFTKSPLALGAQKSVMEFLLINHPLDCPICDQGGECELQDVAMGYGRDLSRFNERKRVVKDKNLGPLIATDMTRCIHCTRCVRFGQEVAGIQELGATGRGEHMQIGTFIEKSVDSELSGNVIDVCPVGALTNKAFRFRARAWEMQSRNAVSPHDCVGSNLHLHVARNRVLRVVPRENEALNEVWIADRDRYSCEGLYSDDRLLAPMVKRAGDWQSVDWGSALAFAAAGLKRVTDQHGPRQIGALASSSATTEELYLLQKLMRGLGSPNIDHRLDQTDFRDQDDAPPFPWMGRRLAELETLDAALVVGSNIRKDQPMVAHRLRKAARAGGAIMLVNPVDYPFRFQVTDKAIVDPPAMVKVLAGIARALAGKQDDGFGPLLADVEPSEIEESIAARLKASERGSVLLGSMALAHPDASVLRALAGYIATQSGAALGCLSTGANGAGASLAGALPHRGPGGQSTDKGLDAQAMLAEPLRGYLLLGIEPELDCADSGAAEGAMKEADFVVCSSAYRSPAMEAYADVLLPTAPFAETSGTYVNVEGGWQSFAGALAPQGEARPAWKVLRVMGNTLELPGFDYLDSSEVRDELHAQVKDMTPSNAGPWWVPPSLPGGRNGALCRVGDIPIYAVDPVVRRAHPLQQTRDAVEAAVRINAAEAARFGLNDGEAARVAQDGSSAILDVIIDPSVADGCVHLHAGVPASVGLGPRYGEITVEKGSP